MEYLLKASAVIAIFYLSYKIFLQRETFFESNRWFLLIGLAIAFIIPFIVIPVYVTQAPIQLQEFLIVESSAPIVSATESFSTLQIINFIYVTGVLLFSIRFIMQFFSLFRLLLSNKKNKQGDYTFVKTNDNISPFSFFRWIVYNPNQFNENELSQILTHEKVHVRQHHSIDILISNLSIIFFWFNPFIWLYKKDLQQNLEFIADYNAQNKSDCKKSYQYLLLKSSLPTHQLALTNNFYNSLIKKRIVMLHKSKSNKINLWKYALVVPVLALFLMSFNTKEVYLEEPIKENNPVTVNSLNKKENTKKTTNKATVTKKESPNSLLNKTQNLKISQDREMVVITKDFTDSNFDKVKDKLSKEGITIKFKGIKRNSDNEITAIKIDVSSKQSNANYNIASDEPISPIKISFDREGGNISIGNANIIHGDKFVFETKNGKHKHSEAHNEIHFDKHEDGEVDVIIEKIHHNSKKGKIHTIIDENTVIDIDIDDDSEIDTDVDVIIIKEDKDGNIVKEETKHVKDKSFILKDGKSVKVHTLGKGKNNKVFFATDDDKTPLFIMDGKIVTEEKVHALDPDKIKSIEVLKGDGAIEKHGEKAKDGVVEIVTKEKN